MNRSTVSALIVYRPIGCGFVDAVVLMLKFAFFFSPPAFRDKFVAFNADVLKCSIKKKKQRYSDIMSDIGRADAQPDDGSASREKTEQKDEKPSMKIRKRALEEASPSPSASAFSLRRGTQSQPPDGEKTAATAEKRRPKPSWMSQEDYDKLNGVKTLTDAEPVQKRLKAPSRRGGYLPRPRGSDDQTGTAEDIPAHLSTSQPSQIADDLVSRDIAYKKQDLNVSIRQHYNVRAWDSKRERRDQSTIIKLRNFNNIIKHMLISESVKEPGWHVLDLGCGKGGDLRKWEQVNVSQYVGVDISNASIMEAIRRYRSNRSRFPVVFATGDAFGLPLPEVLHDFPEVEFPMDIVSMQFCLHYAFETEEKARQTIENVSRSLRPGGVFIGTIPNSEFIGHKIRHLKPGVKGFGNSLYSVTFETQPPKSGEFSSPFGNVYNYYLKDAIDNVPEYIIPFETLRAICSEFGLRLKFKQPFQDYFVQHIPNFFSRLSPKALEGIRKSNGGYGISGEESEATSYFYLAFTFVKAG